MDIELSFTQHISLFFLSGICIWYCSNKLSDIVDYIDNEYKLGSAFGGTIMLSVVTNLPEIAITMNGAIKGDIDLAIGNVLGGITIQSVLLVLFDWSSRKEHKPLSALTSSKTSILQGLFLIAILSFVIIGKQLPNDLLMVRTSYPEWLIVFGWFGSIWAMKRFQRNNKDEAHKSPNNVLPLNRRSALIGLVGIALVILFLGVLLETSSNSIANHMGINGVLFGATILALITSLPEISGGLEFVRNKSYQPIISDIFGGNSFLPVLFLPASLITGKAILPEAHPIDIYLTTVSIIITSVYVMGMVIFSHKRRMGLGVDSWIVLCIYLLSIIGLGYLS
jgi:cation:H+ antiporter